MTTHLRARAAQAGAILAVALGGIVALPSAALAETPGVGAPSGLNAASGDRVTLSFTVTNNNPTDGNGGGNGNGSSGPDDAKRITVTVEPNGLPCTGCGQQDLRIDPGQSRPVSVTLTAPAVPTGQSQTFNVNITATAANGGDPKSASVALTVKGPDAPQSVRQISGRVKDKRGKGLAGATVALQDSVGTRFQTTTDGGGLYAFTSEPGKPIAPGTIIVAAAKDGYLATQRTIRGAAGQSVSAPSLELAAVSATSAPPSANPSLTTDPSAGSIAITPIAPVSGTSAVPIGNATDAATKKSSDSGGSSMLYILLGGLLVALGVGAMVLVVLRRRGNGGNADETGAPLQTGGGGGGGARFDATRVAAPVAAAPRRNDATMVAPRSGAPSLADAPTMLQRPVPAAADDEFPDPYGAPLPRQGGFVGNGNTWDDEPDGYGAGGGQYGGRQADGYGRQGGAYGATQAGGGYDDGTRQQPGGGYGGAQQAPQQRYDEPTGLWQPEGDAYGDEGYGGRQAGGRQQAGGYGGAAYGQGDDHDSWGAQGGGADGYGPRSGGRQQYGGYADEQGYDQGGYDQGGFDQGHGRDGHGQHAAGGYGGQRGGYDQDDYGHQGGRGQAGGAYGRPAQRRPNDWD